MYNSNRELRDYDPKPEVYVAMRKKTTKEERQEIVAYCLAQGKSYKNTAAKYDVSYSQVYQWVKHYEENGDAGLEDRRGKRKSDDEVDELERLRRENLRLKAKDRKAVLDDLKAVYYVENADEGQKALKAFPERYAQKYPKLAGKFTARLRERNKTELSKKRK